MMKITRENYEAYFIDYLEKTLDESMVDDFIEFLQNNPDLKEELALFEPISLEAEEIKFNKKEKLYKHHLDNKTEFEKAAVANLEGDLSEKEKEDFDAYVNAHPGKNKDVELFAKTKLIADTNIKFKNKKKLYRYTLGKKVYLWSVRVAAILILAFAVFSVLNKEAQENIPEIKVAEADKALPAELMPEKAKPAQQETQKKETGKTEKKSPKDEIKKAIPENKPNKKLRENSKGRIKHNDVAQNREPIVVPPQMKSLQAKLEIAPREFALAGISPRNPIITEQPLDERLLADVIREKTNIEEINLSKIKKAGLNLVSNFTKNNFSYETNEEGKIVEYNYDSRLLAFSIPAEQRADTE